MSGLRRFFGIPLAGLAVLGVGLIVAGCGGESTEPPNNTPATKTNVADAKDQNKKLGKGEVPPAANQTAHDRRRAKVQGKMEPGQ